jgi:hypothetical protein
VWIAGPPEQPRKPVTRLERLERPEHQQEPQKTRTEGQQQLPARIVDQVVEIDEKTRTAAAAQAKAVANKPPAIPT